MIEGDSPSMSSVLRRSGIFVAVLVPGLGWGTSPAASQQAPEQPGHHRHADGPHDNAASSEDHHDHAAHSGHAESGHGITGAEAPLEEIGNAPFASIQEVVAELNARDDTDWSRVDLEALRQHLVVMQRFTTDVEVVEREEIDGGLRVVVRGQDAETHRTLRGALGAHAPTLEREMGWTVTVTGVEDRIVLEATSDTPDEAERIRGLGYIGLMASGSHHREHHWQIATGEQPHR